MLFDKKIGKGQMLLNAAVPMKSIEKKLLLEQIDEWLSAGFEKGDGEPPGLERYRTMVQAALAQKLREKKEQIELLLRGDEEYV